MRGYLIPAPDGDAGTFAALHTMRQLARAAAIQLLVRTEAVRLVLGVRSPALQVRILRDWTSAHTDFLADPTPVETLHDPAWSIRQILTRGLVQVDCDDVAMIAAAMGLSIGLRARYVVVGFSSPNAPFRHVWTDLSGPGPPRWVPVDPTRPLQGLDRLPITRMAALEV